MGPNFIKNIDGGDPAKDRAGRIRSIFAIFLLVFTVGGFFLQKNIAIVGDSPVLKNFIEPLSQVDNFFNGQGGDVVVSPPVEIRPQLPELQSEMLGVTKFSAHSIIVKDHETGMVLFRKNEYDKWPMASITKLMSALVILEKNPDWATSTVAIGPDSLDTHMYAGDIYSLEELWNAALIASSNKAILSLANALGWPEPAFVERMNQKARELGMLDTVFADASGLEEGNISTASDIVMLLNEAMKQEKIRQTLITPEYNLYSNEREKSHHMYNTNWLLLGWVTNDFYKLYGGKTGYIVASGYNFTMRVENEDNHILDVVILGADTHEARFTEARDVAMWVFDNYKWPD